MEPPRPNGIDDLLRRSMAARPIPSLPLDFEKRLLREVGRSRQPRGLGKQNRLLLSGYGLVSAVTSAVVMHGQGLDWGIIAATILGPLAVLAATVSWTQRRRPSNG